MLEQIKTDLTAAMKQQNMVKVSVLRMVIAEANNFRIAKQVDPTAEDLTTIIQKEVKQREESKLLAEQMGRRDLVEKSESEKKVLISYLPEQISQEELSRVIDDAVTETGAKSMAEMGKVMASLMPKIKGRADGTTVSQMVRDRLSS